MPVRYQDLLDPIEAKKIFAVGRRLGDAVAKHNQQITRVDRRFPALRNEILHHGHGQPGRVELVDRPVFADEQRRLVARVYITNRTRIGIELAKEDGDELRRVQGAYAIAVVSADRPDQIVAAKTASPLVIGYGQGENLLASDVPALLPHTRDVCYLQDGEIAVLDHDGVRLMNMEGQPVMRDPQRRIDMGRKGKSGVQEKYSDRAMAAETLKAYAAARCSMPTG